MRPRRAPRRSRSFSMIQAPERRSSRAHGAGPGLFTWIPPGNPRLRLLDFTAPLGEDPVHPRVGELAARDGRHVVRFGFLSLAKAPHEERGVLPWNDDDAALVADDDVPRMDDNATALDGVVDLAGAPMEGTDRRRPPGIDRVAQGQDACEIADVPVDDESGEAA